MIVVLHEKSIKDKDFGSVRYNEDKIDKGKGELVSAKNFPSFIDVRNKDQVKQYLKSIEPRNKKFENVHFHVSISCKGREYSKETLKNIGDDFMKNLGYDNQPYIAVFHSDTKNNHVHLVSTNVNVENGKQMVHSYTKLKCQEALAKAEKNILGIDYNLKLENLLSYSCNNISQIQKLLKHNGFDSYIEDDSLSILYHDTKLRDIEIKNIKLTNGADRKSAKQVTAILNKYKEISNNKVFGIVNDNKVVDWKSQLQKDLKTKFGFDILFSYSEDKTPFGYTLIDNKNKCVFKGSDIADMKNIFTFTDIKVDKTIFDFLENSIFKNDETKLAAKFYFERKNNFSIPDFLLDFGKKVPYTDFIINRNIVNGFCKVSVKETIDFNTHFSTVKVGENYFVFNERDKYIFNINDLVNEKTAKQFENRISNTSNISKPGNSEFENNNNENLKENNINKSDKDILTELIRAANRIQPSGEDQNSASNYRKRRRKFKR
ncbi:relaxase/mobilization nuclease domain-containing protein [Chryseobacterium antibioticum]|uniref:Relaxase/mobilization nuclease domain-containing protein n=1 Tax=Chryseobacterium pyrolae TaxID=2987481 RepID=A0ABT2IMX2_9FLAO|nr:relaxase/mobilization nuclease domain-containing protein [Chryseobacterium pyrolae]MCT2409983.1 relaxase/mobilization nuclease domain-containing protein [Chryseobacterium pyrolae]